MEGQREGQMESNCDLMRTDQSIKTKRRRKIQLTGHKRLHFPIGISSRRRKTADEGWQGKCKCGWTKGPFKNRMEAENAHRNHLIMARPVCSSCNIETPRHMMSKGSKHKCKICAKKHLDEWKSKNPERYADAQRKCHLRQTFGISTEEYNAMFAAQGNVCAICLKAPRDPRGFHPHIDHCHISGKVRGILCHKCNQGLGQFSDNVDVMMSAVRYLKNFEKKESS